MAIAVERKSLKINWFALAIGIFALVFVSGTVYFLFIMQPPGIEKIIPPPPEANVVKGVKEIIDTVNIASVIQRVQISENPISAPTAGELGRINPFAPLK